MKHLSGLDAAFLHAESPETPMHVGSLHVMDLPEGFDPADFFERAKAHMAARLHLAEVFTRKLALMPFDLSDPVWVDDEDIDIDYHIRPITLARPGSNRQLQQIVARLHSSLLDRSRPLWEMFIIDGLRSGQVAMYLKAHHAGIDGQAGVALAQAVFDTSAAGRVIEPRSPKPRRDRYQLGMAELAGAALRNTAQQYVKLFKLAPEAAKVVRGLLTPARGEEGAAKAAAGRRRPWLAPRTPLNVSVTNQRNFVARTVPLADVNFVSKQLGVSVNDVVMTATAGALRRHLERAGALPAKPLLASVPVSLREAGDTTANNQVSMIVVELATDEADPVLRLARIHASAQSAKALMSRVKAAIPTDFPVFGAPWLLSGLSASYGRSRLADLLPPPCNLVISNVAGVPVPVYFAGASVICYYPVSIVTHGMSLNVTVQSYNGRIDYGLISCRRALGDTGDLGDAILAEHEGLLALAREKAGGGIAPPAPAPARPARAAAPLRSKKPPAAAETREKAKTAVPSKPAPRKPRAKPDATARPRRAAAAKALTQ